MSPLLKSSLLLALIGPMPVAAGADLAAESEAWLAYMKESVRVYDIRPADDPGTSYELQAEPVLRFTNPMGRARDGSVFLWLDTATRRPLRCRSRRDRPDDRSDRPRETVILAVFLCE